MFRRNILKYKKVVFCICFLVNVFILFSYEEIIIEPLIIDINIDDEIWLNGEMIAFNGWSPNIRMIVFDNKIIGIDENSILEELLKYFGIGIRIKGLYKLKLKRVTNLPYYNDPLLVFEIMDYNNIEIIEL